MQDFNGVWTRNLAITGAMLYQLSYEATDVGSRSIVGSYVGWYVQLWEHMNPQLNIYVQFPFHFRSSYRIYFICH